MITKTLGSLAHSVFMTWSEIYCIDLSVNLITHKTLLLGKFAKNRLACSLLLSVCYTFQLSGSFLHW